MLTDQCESSPKLPMKTITIELPEAIITLLGGPKRAAEATRNAVVIELFRTHQISQGKAAEVLGISKFGEEMLDLMKEHGIYHGPLTKEDAAQEIETIRRLTPEPPR